MENKEKKITDNTIVAAFISIVWFLVMTWLGQWVWNMCMPRIFGLPMLNYVEAALVKIVLSIFAQEI